MIQSIGSKIKDGIKFFVNHNADNSIENRKDIGKVVGSYVKNIDDKLSQIVIGHFDNEEEIKNMDINSMEADISYDENSGEVQEVKEITGIAVGSSSENSPAFPGAVRLASLQCFEKEDVTKKIIIEPGKGVRKMPTFEEVKTFVRDHNVWPSQLYDENILKQDKEFQHIFSEKESLAKDKEKLESDFKKYKEENENIIKEGQKASVKDRLKKLLPEGLTKNQESFIQEEFNPDALQDLSDDGLKKYIDSAKEQYGKYAKLFGSKEENEINDKKEDTKIIEEKTEVDEIVDTILKKEA